MFSIPLERLWDQDPSFHPRILRFISSLHVSEDYFGGFEKYTKHFGNDTDAHPSYFPILKLGLLLVHPDAYIRNSTAEFCAKTFPIKGLQLFDPGNMIDEMPSSIKPLIISKMIENYKDANTSYINFATFWLGMYGTEDCLPFLIKNLSHPSKNIVKQVIRSLGIFGSSRSIPYLLPLIHKFNEYSEIQRAVIEAVGILGEEGIGVQSLIHELYTQNETDYENLEMYLKSFGPRIIKYISCEIEFEKNAKRKNQLQEFCDKIAHTYSIRNSKQYTILL